MKITAKEKSARKIRPIKIVSGTIIPGLGIAKKMGFPTINIKINSSLKDGRPQGLLFGIYAVYVMDARKIYPGVLHYGKRMFHRAPVSFEVHCLMPQHHVVAKARCRIRRMRPACIGDSAQNNKAKHVTVLIMKRIRAVKNFATVGALKRRIHRDIKEAKRVLK